MLYEEEIVNPYCLTNVLNLLDLKGLQKWCIKLKVNRNLFIYKKKTQDTWYDILWLDPLTGRWTLAINPPICLSGADKGGHTG